MKSESEGIKKQSVKLGIGILAIVVLTFAVYRPILPGSFLMDDERLAGSDNALVNGQFTPYTIWFQTDFTLATFGWWVEHLMFGKNPAGYHVVNIVLQAISALLLWRLLALLKIPGAWLAGALFAVHPVCVNSMARIAELKNTLSMPFCLLSFIGYLRYEAAALYPPSDNEQHDSAQATWWYVVSLIVFVLALLAKTTVVMLPVVILLCALWQRRRVTWKDVLHLLPFFVLSLAFGLMSIWFQKNQALPSTPLKLLPISFLQRLAGAGYDFWFYLGKAFFPFNLNIQYPLWKIDAGSVAVYLPGLLLCAIFVLCFQFRRSWGRHILFGLGSFAVLLFPALGFFDAQFLTMWQVSDHLQYTALAAIVPLVTSALAVLLNQTVFRIAATALLLGCSVLCFKHVEVFKTQEGLMADTVKKNPLASGSYNDLGITFAEKKNYSKAIHDFLLSLEDNPKNAEARMNLGYALVLQGKFPEAETEYLAALEANPRAALAHTMYARLLEMQGRNTEAIYHFKMAIIYKPDAGAYLDLASLEFARGNSHEAVMELRQALAFKKDPDRAMVLNNLAWILATCPDDSVRNGSEAVLCAEEACRLTANKQAGMLGTLAAAYAEAGRFPEAVATAEKGIQEAADSGNAQFAKTNQQLLLLYRAGKPFHSRPAGGFGR